MIRNLGDPATAVNWTAEVVKGASVAQLSATTGVSTPGHPVNLGVKLTSAATTAAGGRNALIRISNALAQNSPQYVVVVANVAPSGSAPIPDPDPAGLMFVRTGAAQPAAQDVTVNVTSSQSVAFSTSVETIEGGAWLAAQPSFGSTSAVVPATVAVSVSAAALAPGVYRGQVHIAIGGAVRAVNVTLIAAAATAPAASLGHRGATGCQLSRIAMTQTGLVNNFAIPAGWPAALIVQVSDDCGMPVTGASVVAQFSNGDPPLPLIGDDDSGEYSATWQPRAVTPQMTVLVRAIADPLQAASMPIGGDGQANSVSPPSIVIAGLLNNLNPLVGAPLAPGGVTQVYGDNLVAEPSAPGTAPLPTLYKGVEAVIGGLSAPIYYVSKTQLTVQVPAELQPNRSYATLLLVNDSYTLPQPLDLIPAAPGTVSFADGTLVAQHGDYSLVDAAHPAKPGEFIAIYLVGMGATSPAVKSGTQAPADPPARVSLSPQVTVDGARADMQYAGLTPGGVGLYQINFRVPVDARAGNLDVVITQNGVVANATRLMVGK